MVFFIFFVSLKKRDQMRMMPASICKNIPWCFSNKLPGMVMVKYRRFIERRFTIYREILTNGQSVQNESKFLSRFLFDSILLTFRNFDQSNQMRMMPSKEFFSSFARAKTKRNHKKISPKPSQWSWQWWRNFWREIGEAKWRRQEKSSHYHNLSFLARKLID